MPAAVRRGHFARSIDRPCSQYPSNKISPNAVQTYTLHLCTFFRKKKNTQPRANLFLLGHRHRSEVLWNCGKMLTFQLGTFQTFQTGNVSKLLSHTVCRPKQGRSELCHLTAERLTSTNSPSVCTNMLPRRCFFLPSPWPRETLSWIANSTNCVKTVPYLCFCAVPLARKKTWHAASHLLQGQESRSIWLKNAPAFLHRFRTSTDFCFRKGETLNRTGQPSSNTPALIFSKRRRKSYKPAFPEKARVGVPPATGSSFKSVSTIQRKKVEDLLHLLCCFFWKNARKFNVHNACIQRHTLTRRIFLAWLYCNFVILKYGPKCFLGQKHVAEAEKYMWRHQHAGPAWKMEKSVCVEPVCGFSLKWPKCAVDGGSPRYFWFDCFCWLQFQCWMFSFSLVSGNGEETISEYAVPLGLQPHCYFNFSWKYPPCFFWGGDVPN